MFPATTKEGRLLLGHSPKNRDNKSTYLPYFKRFPNQRFHSHDRKRPGDNEHHIKRPSRRFFTQQKTEAEQQASVFGRFNSNPQIKEKTPLKLRPKLFRQKFERQSTRMKRNSENSLEERHNRVPANSSFQLHNNGSYVTPAQLLRNTHNLTEHEQQEVYHFEQVYYFGQNCSGKIYNPMQKAKEGDQGYPWVKGDHVAYRYQFVDVLGEGSFGQVFKVIDHKNNKTPMALKMVKFNDKYLTQARIEIKILKMIRDKDPNSSKNCVEIKDYFSFRGRVCMTFSLLSMNLYELIKSNGYYGLPLDLIRRFVLQVLNGIHFLHKHHIIHADLKPENILLKEMNKSGVKIIDFGSSCLEGETIYTYIQSRYYRAPEVILGLPYDRKIDIWSFGCIIAQLHLGYPLFGGEDEHQQMCLIIEVLGMPPKDIIPNAKRWHVFFDKDNVFKPHEKRTPPASKALTTALQLPDPDFTDFIRTCLQWHPDRRTEAIELMKHRWVLKDLPPDFKEQHLKFVQEEEAQMQEDGAHLRRSRKHTFSIRDKHRLIK